MHKLNLIKTKYIISISIIWQNIKHCLCKPSPSNWIIPSLNNHWSPMFWAWPLEIEPYDCSQQFFDDDDRHIDEYYIAGVRDQLPDVCKEGIHLYLCHRRIRHMATTKIFQTILIKTSSTDNFLNIKHSFW